MEITKENHSLKQINFVTHKPIWKRVHLRWNLPFLSSFFLLPGSDFDFYIGGIPALNSNLKSCSDRRPKPDNCKRDWLNECQWTDALLLHLLFLRLRSQFFINNGFETKVSLSGRSARDLRDDSIVGHGNSLLRFYLTLRSFIYTATLLLGLTTDLSFETFKLAMWKPAVKYSPWPHLPASWIQSSLINNWTICRN